MEISSAKWLSEMVMLENSTRFFHQYKMNVDPLEYSLDDLNFESFSCDQSYSSYKQDFNPKRMHNINGSSHDFDTSQRPAKQSKIDTNWNSYNNKNNYYNYKASSSSSSQIIPFDHSNSSPAPVSQQCITHPDQYFSPKYGQGTKTRTALHAQYHVLAERKRREKLSERFIALSALLPGLKKMDKASVLGDATKYLKQLQERVKTLEEQVAKKTEESVVFVKKSQLSIDDETSSSDENFDGHNSSQQLPEIEARVSDKDVLIRIHCESKKGCVAYILNQIEKLNLSVVDTNILPFGNSILDITVVSKMDVDFSLTVKDLVKNLRLALLQFM